MSKTLSHFSKKLSSVLPEWGPSTDPHSSSGRSNPRKHDVPSVLGSFVRIASNLVAAGLVLLSLITVLVLVNTGMFHRRVLINDLSYDPTYFYAYGQSCRLDDQGFIANTCAAVETHTMTQAAWTAAGVTLARQWLANASSPMFVTTCIEGPPDDESAWAALVFVAGYDAFPECQPPGGAQEIAGLAMSETTIRDDYPTGAYVLTVYADKTMHDSIEHVNSDGTTDVVIAYTNHSLISVDGIVTLDLIGINTVEHSLPLGRRYMVTAFAYETVMDITSRLDASVPWWNVGRESKKAISISWDTGHDVAHSSELVAIQVALSVGALLLLSSDIYLTIQGLRGYLLHKPVMTYDLLAGLERRKVLLLVVGLGALPSLLYADVARIYYSTASGNLIWYLSTILVGIFVVFSSLFGLTLLQLVPAPTTKLIPFSPALYAYGTITAIVVVWDSQYADLANAFNSAPFTLAFNVSGVFRPSGAYATAGIPTVLDLMAWQTVASMGICLAVSIAYEGLWRRLTYGHVFTDVGWTQSNAFLKYCGMPHWISGLPLDQLSAIKIGHKLFCKPSTQAVLGYASLVTERPTPAAAMAVTQRGDDAKDQRMHLVGIYALAPVLGHLCRCLPRWLQPWVHGTVEKNAFTHTKDERIGHQAYYHHRGTCAN
ncbi:Aste57867_9714 [Aphanomyces stellatus]|uniref:Aste57867_9714 protein n=1 Tax=Aphanomyces stellatus TaxID=120398 RepID=A0A485KNM6_9STRA|nr:hypothetical protein As57867_009676 [Aphanomyces stellatus]VFT86593.1 Aste57867_9714 [Aphanomyces stellatus]